MDVYPDLGALAFEGPRRDRHTYPLAISKTQESPKRCVQLYSRDILLPGGRRTADTVSSHDGSQLPLTRHSSPSQIA